MQDGTVISYKFLTQDHMISDNPNATRWFGELVIGENDYYLYPIDESGISVGEFEIIQLHEKFIKIRFLNGLITGEWYLRNINGGEILFWKPKPEGFICTMNSTQVTETVSVEDKINVTQAFGAHLVIDGRNFSGPCMSSGIVTGLDRVSTLFPDSFLEMFTKKLQDKMPELVVDIDHELLQIMRGNVPTEEEKDFTNTGEINEVLLKKNKKLNYIWCKGQTTHPVPAHAGLSVTLETEAVWDDELNIYVAVNGEPIGISITDKIQPACKICWVE
jgi:hypothetical protein